MKHYSKNKKLNKVLNTIEQALLSMCETEQESINEIKRYVKEFPNEIDYNIGQYGNLLIYYTDIYRMYAEAGYKTAIKWTNAQLWATYLKQIGYIAREIVKQSK